MPLLKPMIRSVLHEVADRFQTGEAVSLLLDDALGTEGRETAVGHPLRVLGDSAVRVLPEIGTEPVRRERIFTAALDWLTA